MPIIQIRYGDILAADGLMIGDGAEHIVFNRLHGHMAGYGHQSVGLQHVLYLLSGIAKETGKFHAVIAHFLEPLEHTVHILRHFFAGGIQLICHRNLFHDFILHFCIWQ